MPSTWIFVLSLILPLAAGVLVVDSRFFIEWLWYQGYVPAYDILNAMSVDPYAQALLGGWPLPIFIITVLYYWFGHEVDEEEISRQYLLLPLAYVPFLTCGQLLTAPDLNISAIYRYPMIAIFGGYLYIFPWVLFVWAFRRLHLLAE